MHMHCIDIYSRHKHPYFDFYIIIIDMLLIAPLKFFMANYLETLPTVKYKTHNGDTELDGVDCSV